MASTRPQRNRRPPQRYEPEEIPVDDYDDDYESASASDHHSSGQNGAEGHVSVEGPEGKAPEGKGGKKKSLKRYRGEFDGLDSEEEEYLNEPNEYDETDGFAVPDDYEDSREYEGSKNDEEEEDESFDDDEEEDLEEPEYDSDEEDVYEEDVLPRE